MPEAAFDHDDVADVDPDSSTPDEIVANEEKKKERAQQVLDDIANADENY